MDQIPCPCGPDVLQMTPVMMRAMEWTCLVSVVLGLVVLAVMWRHPPQPSTGTDAGAATGASIAKQQTVLAAVGLSLPLLGVVMYAFGYGGLVPLW